VVAEVGAAVRGSCKEAMNQNVKRQDARDAKRLLAV
jgi:hypothetical protein